MNLSRPDRGASGISRRILLLGNGSSIHLVRLANGLAACGCEVHLASQHGFLPSLDPAVGRHEAPHRGGPGYFLNVAWFRRLLRRLRADIVNAHYAGGYGTMAALSRVRPLVITAWGSDVLTTPWSSWIKRVLVRGNLLHCDRIVVMADGMREAVRKLSRKDAEVIPFGVDTELFRPLQPSGAWSFPAQAFVVGICKSLEPVYRLDVAIRAMDVLRRERGDLKVFLAIVGEGGEAENLRGLISDLSLQDRVLLAGPRDHAGLPEFYNGISAYAVTSESEGLCVSALEAAACGKPVISTPVGAMGKLAEAGFMGLSIEPGDPVGLSRAIARLADHPDEAARYGRAGLEHVRAHYEWDVTIRKTTNLFEDILRSRNGG